MTWQEYQQQTADIFRRLGCTVEIEAKVRGARAEHKIDVLVRFQKFGIETRWAIECKFWGSAVTKEKVLTLKGVVDDMGADRGVLVSSGRFQRGAVYAATKTNITLTDLDELRNTTKEELLALTLDAIGTKTIELSNALQNLYEHKKLGPGHWVSMPRFSGIDGNTVITTMSRSVNPQQKAC